MYQRLYANKYLDTKPICLRNPYSQVIIDNQPVEISHKSRCRFYSYGLCIAKGQCSQQHYPVVFEKDLPAGAVIER